jgi:hypothetical protein
MSDFINPLTDYSPQMEAFAPSSATEIGRRSAPGVFTEDEELDLASRFLEVNSEQELHEFVDSLIKTAGRALNQTMEPPLEQDIGDILKSIAKVALPIVGGVVGGFVGGPPGAALGSSLASTAGRAFGLELEGLSPEDSEFEISKQFVKFGGAVVKNALKTDPSNDRAKIARRAATVAARAHAPGLLKIIDSSSASHQEHRSTGYWFSHNNKGDGTVHDLDRTQNGQSSTSYGTPRQNNGRGLTEEDQMDLAAELMEMESEEDFENFLGDLISKGVGAAGKFIDSPTGQALGGVLKDAAKQLLPVAGQAVGTYFGGPTGGQVGGALGSAASNLFEAETEEQEWEAANTFIRVAVDTINHAAQAHPGAHPHVVARNALTEATQRHAPHLLDAMPHGGREWSEGRHHRNHSGRWARHGRRIIVFGV